jgi:hypothetical protein
MCPPRPSSISNMNFVGLVETPRTRCSRTLSKPRLTGWTDRRRRSGSSVRPCWVWRRGFPLTGLGIPHVQRPPPRRSRNRRTGEVIHIRGKGEIAFRPAKELPAKELKETVSRKSRHAPLVGFDHKEVQTGRQPGSTRLLRPPSAEPRRHLCHCVEGHVFVWEGISVHLVANQPCLVWPIQRLILEGEVP